MRTFLLDRADSALVVVDIQERLAAVMSKRERVTTNTVHLIAAARLLALPVILTEQYPKGLGQTVDEVKSELAVYEPFEKTHFSCCDEPGFLGMVSALGKRNIIISGMETHVCVLQTVLGLLREGYGVHLVADAVCSRKKDDYLIGLGVAREAGAVITSTETALFQLLRRAGTEEFKAISRRIK